MGQREVPARRREEEGGAVSLISTGSRESNGENSSEGEDKGGRGDEKGEGRSWFEFSTRIGGQPDEFAGGRG